MYALLLIFVATCIVAGCKEENITQIVGPQDWQPPVVMWLSPPDAEVRGTVGLDVLVHDSSQVTEVRLYLDGREQDTVFASPYRFELLTDSLLDGVHLCEARAWDEFGNMGVSPILRINVANSIAQGPRVLWVPDSFQTIQSAINAAQDFDTIRVRDGTYYETLNTFGKGIWIESEHGPLRCAINAAGSSRVFMVPPNSVRATIRGFAITGGNYLLALDYSTVDILNNVVTSDSAEALLITSYAGGRICNNLFSHSQYGVEVSYHWGVFFNNIVQNVRNVAFWNAAVLRNPLEYGHNLFWANGQNYGYFDPGEGDVYGDPLLDMTNGMLLAGSPAIDAGNPEITDRDGTRSDIGPFGGPYAY
jgi:hypothetical protein